MARAWAWAWPWPDVSQPASLPSPGLGGTKLNNTYHHSATIAHSLPGIGKVAGGHHHGAHSVVGIAAVVLVVLGFLAAAMIYVVTGARVLMVGVRIWQFGLAVRSLANPVHSTNQPMRLLLSLRQERRSWLDASGVKVLTKIPHVIPMCAEA